MGIVQKIDSYYSINEWLDGDGLVHPDVPEEDVRIIRALGYALVVAVVIEVLLLAVLFAGLIS